MENNKNILMTTKEGIQTIILNRSKMRNAITSVMYDTLTAVLYNSAQDNNIHMVVFTGAGDFFSSGNDMMTFNKSQIFNVDGINKAIMKYKNFVDALINFPKLLVAIVNGPAIGIAATMLALFDVVYASEKAYFYTPFTKLGFTAEGCSTYLFPRIMGPSKASEMLYFGYKLNAIEAKQYGLVSEVYDSKKIEDVWKYLEKISELSIESIIATKCLLKKWNKELLLKINEEEANMLMKRIQSSDFVERLMKFMSSKKSKL